MKKIEDLKKVHMIGVTGQGMTALAQVLLSRGIEISGSDTSEGFNTNSILKKLGIKVANNFKEENIPEDADLIISSSAYLRDDLVNPEVEKAKKTGKLISYSDVLALLVKSHKTIAVTGCNGKTTTTALLGFTLAELGFDPTVIVGGEVLNWNSNARVGKPGGLLIIEADEYKDSFLKYKPLIGAIITNISFDHPDYFFDLDAYKNSFSEFAKNIRSDGFLIGCGDDEIVGDILKNSPVKSDKKNNYGFNNNPDYLISDYQSVNDLLPHTKFKIKDARYELNLVGRHNALNAGAVLSCVNLYLNYLGRDIPHLDEKINDIFSKFKGTRRRFEILSTKPITIIDDYGHHPVAVGNTIESIKEIWPDRRLIVVFQPHTYSRTVALLEDFAKVLTFADIAVVLDIYASAREKKKIVSAEDLVNEINKIKDIAIYVSSEKFVNYIKDTLKEGDILLTCGAGDIWKSTGELVKDIRNFKNKA